MGVIQDIPKLYTALAEWTACLIFVLLLDRRWGRGATCGIMAVSLAILGALQSWIGVAPIHLWIPGMIVAFAVMYGMMLLCCKAPATNIGFYWAIAFMFAEFAASLEWQFYSFYSNGLGDSAAARIVFLVVFYGGTFGLAFMLQRNRLDGVKNFHVTNKEMMSAIVVAVGAFLISNISYVDPNTPLSGQSRAEIFYIRTLVDLAGWIMLIAQQDRWRDMQTRMELDSINGLLQRQYEQYRQSRENIEAINRKYHDLKHQIGVIRLEPSAEKREEYLNQLESGMEGIGPMQKTGNNVLDTILFSKQLYCSKHQIAMNAVADGAQLGFMDVMDICSIFGNALDNAIESVLKLPDKEKRLIRIAVYTQNNFLMIRVENYYEERLEIEDGEYRSTKKNKANHGYGIKSIRYTAEKYSGSVSIQAKDNWFCLRVLLPIKE